MDRSAGGAGHLEHLGDCAGLGYLWAGTRKAQGIVTIPNGKQTSWFLSMQTEPKAGTRCCLNGFPESFGTDRWFGWLKDFEISRSGAAQFLQVHQIIIFNHDAGYQSKIHHTTGLGGF